MLPWISGLIKEDLNVIIKSCNDIISDIIVETFGLNRKQITDLLHVNLLEFSFNLYELFYVVFCLIYVLLRAYEDHLSEIVW